MDKKMETERSYPVVKSNAIIQKSRYDLSLQEQKVILYLVSKIKEEDDDFREYEFGLRELCDIFGIIKCSKNYSNFKNSIQTLRNKSFWVRLPGKQSLCSWIEKVEIRDNGRVVLRLDSTLKPYLLQLKREYTAYDLSNVLPMDSTYSIRLYELLRSYAYQGEFEISLPELKEMLCVSTDYSIYNNFKVRVIDKAISEINYYTDLQVSFEPIRTVRTITALRFTIDQSSERDCIVQRLKQGAKLNGK